MEAAFEEKFGQVDGAGEHAVCDDHGSNGRRVKDDDPVALQYSVEQLKSLGKACSTRLPPASAVQAMFLYERQRQTEVEKLFHVQMFRMARAEDASNSTVARILKLEDEMKKTQSLVTAKDVAERLETSKIRFTTQQAKIDECNQKLEAHDQRLTSVLDNLEALKAATAAQIESAVTESEIADDLAGAKKDVDVLFDERDAMVKLMDESNDRISKLESLVRQLTLQVSTSTSPSRSPAMMAQRLPVTTTNGQNIELSVPRGTGLTNGRENRSLIRSFTPGEQWTGQESVHV